MSPACLYDIEDGTQASPLIGYAFDYYPIYGGYGHADPMDTNSEILRLRSSYRLRAITDRTTLPDGMVLPPTLHGPSLDSVPLGGYMEDFEYVEGLGDLDEHNGRFCITADYPDGIYAYFTTLGWVNDVYGYGIKPVFPYVVGTAYYGEVYPGDGNTGPNSGFVVISEPVTAYILPSTAVAELENAPLINLYPNPATDAVIVEIDQSYGSVLVPATIVDMNGATIVQTILFPGTPNRIDLGGLANGVYSVRIGKDDQDVAYRMVVVR